MAASLARPAALSRSSRPLRQRIADMFTLARQRRQLAELDARALEDLGLTADDVRAETARPFWDAPAGWRC